MKINGLFKAATNDTNGSCHSWLLLQFSGKLFSEQATGKAL
jgi:hypothetical protein